jgi:hypothetical protein
MAFEVFFWQHATGAGEPIPVARNNPAIDRKPPLVKPAANGAGSNLFAGTGSRLDGEASVYRRTASMRNRQFTRTYAARERVDL